MLSWIVGVVDGNAAAVLIAMFIGFGVVGTALVVKWQNTAKMSNEFVVAKLQEADKQALALAQNSRDEKIKLAQIASNQVVELARINGAQIEGAKLVSKPSQTSNYDADTDG